MNAMDSEQFFLKWNNFESNLASGFADLLKREAMVDVTLAAEGKIVQAHKIILSICSSYFRNMFQVNPCHHPIVVLKDVRYQELTDMLDFMYKGEANVRQEDLPSFLKLAETLKVKGLAGNSGELDENTMKKNSSESQSSSLTQDSSLFVKEEPINDFLDKDSVMSRKKSKRCMSPFVYAESKDLPHSPNIKLEMEEFDNNFVRNSVNSCNRIAIMKEERLSDTSVDSYVENHVSCENLEIEKNAGPSSLDDNSDAMQQGAHGVVKAYSFVESCFGGHLLVLGGFSYRRKSITPGKSYWFCCDPKCPAKGILSANGDFQETNSKHTHEPDFENIRRKEKLAELKKLALQVNASGQELLEALDIKNDIKRYLNFIRTCRRREQNRNRDSSVQTPLHVGLNYKRVPSRTPSKELLFHSGHLFRQDSVNPLNEKRKYWRCRVKKCKARAKTDDSGNLTILKPYHSHPLEISEEASDHFRKLFNDDTERIYEAGVQSNSPKKLTWNMKKQTYTQNQEKFKMGDSVPIFEGANSTTESVTSFSFEKLMSEALPDSYCATSEISEST